MRSSPTKRHPQDPVAVLGLPLNSLTVDETVDAIERLVLSGGTHQVSPVNLDVWLNSLSDPHLHRILAGCSLAVPDGMPLVWVSGLLGCPLAERITGVDLVPKLAELSARKGYRIFLLGGRPGVAERATALLERNHPGVRIVGSCAPTEEKLNGIDQNEVIGRIRAVKPDILLVAFGNPKQEKWIWAHHKSLGVPVAMGIGGSLDILVGDMKRAPRWIQQCGLEWAMRLVQEPARLGPRYLRDFLGLARRLPLALLAAWIQPPWLGQGKVTFVSTPKFMHVYVYGKLTADSAADLHQAVSAAIASAQSVVVHLQEVKHVTAAGLGILMGARRQLLEAGLSLELAGLKPGLRFLLYAWCVQPLFEEWRPAARFAEHWTPGATRKPASPCEE